MKRQGVVSSQVGGWVFFSLPLSFLPCGQALIKQEGRAVQGGVKHVEKQGRGGPARAAPFGGGRKERCEVKEIE